MGEEEKEGGGNHAPYTGCIWMASILGARQRQSGALGDAWPWPDLPDVWLGPSSGAREVLALRFSAMRSSLPTSRRLCLSVLFVLFLFLRAWTDLAMMANRKAREQKLAVTLGPRPSLAKYAKWFFASAIWKRDARFELTRVVRNLRMTGIALLRLNVAPSDGRL